MHIIRLRRPWQKNAGPDDKPRRIDVPEIDHEPAPQRAQTSTYRRSFNLPSGLADSSRVYLRVDGWQGSLVSATLNDAPLPFGPNNIDAEITSWLRPHNKITITLAGGPGQKVRLSGEVSLAIDDG